MWWNLVDVSKIPKSPRPKNVARKPKWHSMASDMEPVVSGLEDPKDATMPLQRTLGTGGKGYAGVQPALSRSVGTSSLGRNEGGDRRRPKSAPGGSNPSRRPNSATLSISHGRPRRPQSAPRLLRGTGLLLKRPADIQEDETLQRMEEFSVMCNMDAFKREKHVFKDKVSGIEMLSDPVLYDLKVLHNGRQRLQSLRFKQMQAELENEMKDMKKHPPAANDTMKRRRLEEIKRKLQGPTGSENVRELCKELDANLRKHAKRLDLKANLKERQSRVLRKSTRGTNDFDVALLQFKEDEFKMTSKTYDFTKEGISGYYRSVATSNMMTSSFIEDEDDSSEEQSDIQQPATTIQQATRKSVVDLTKAQTLTPRPSEIAVTISTSHQASRQASRRSSLTDAVAITLAEIVGFLIGCCGSVEAAFSALDRNGNGSLTACEWESGLQRLGFKDEVACVYRMLGKGPEEGASLEELQALFSPCLESLRRSRTGSLCSVMS